MQIIFKLSGTTSRSVSACNESSVFASLANFLELFIHDRELTQDSLKTFSLFISYVESLILLHDDCLSPLTVTLLLFLCVFKSL